jgi:hypothetical protein
MSNTDAYQEAVNKLITYIDQTVDFAKGQLPDIAQEILTYGATMEQFWMWFFIVFAGISFVTMIATIIGSMDSDNPAPAMMFFAFLGLSIFAAHDYVVLIKIKEAPKLYVMEQMHDMLPSVH